MGRTHAMCYENLKYFYNLDICVNLYAVVTSRSAGQLPIAFPKVYRSFEEMLRDPKVDAVDICEPNDMHKDYLIAAIQAGKHIYCEKPLTLDLASALEVKTACERSHYHGISRMAFEYRFTPAILRAKQLIGANVLGKLVQFNFKYYGSEFIDPNRPLGWQSDKKRSGGGVLFALGTHSLDLIRYLVGDVDEVFAQEKTHFPFHPDPQSGKRVPVTIEDIVNVQLSCGDVPGTLLLSQVAAGSGIDFSFEIYGEKGSIKFTQQEPNVLYYFNAEDPKEPNGGFGGFKAIETAQKYGGRAVFPPERVNISWSRYHIASICDFVEAVGSGRPSHPDLEDGFQVQKIVDAIYRSANERTIRKVE